MCKAVRRLDARKAVRTGRVIRVNPQEQNQSVFYWIRSNSILHRRKRTFINNGQIVPRLIGIWLTLL